MMRVSSVDMVRVSSVDMVSDEGQQCGHGEW